MYIQIKEAIMGKTTENYHQIEKVIIEDWHGINFVEFFHLIKTNGGWKISSKTGVQYVESYYPMEGCIDNKVRVIQA
jgi:hypothetical protein